MSIEASKSRTQDDGVLAKPLTVREIALAVDGRINHSAYENRAVTGIATDSRADMRGKLYIPFKGARVDGHTFIANVFADGAAASLSENELPEISHPVIYVKDTKLAIMRLAEYYRSLFDVHVVGITGSVGKTTTKDLVAAVLSQKYNVLKTEGNFNNEIGLPLTIFRLTEQTRYAVIEMGMSNFGEIHNLSKIARPQTGVITNIGVSHIEKLGSREGILKAKSELFDYMPEDGAAVLYAGDDLLASLKGSRKNLIYYGTDSENDCYATDITYHGIHGVDFILNQKGGGAVPVTVSVPGFHMVLNALCAAAVGMLSGLSLDQIKAGIEGFRPAAMRMERLKGKSGADIINDVYNANPASVKAALDVLSHADGEKICVLGDMLELGAHADMMHYETGRYAAQLHIDRILTFGEKSAHTHEGALSMNSTATAAHFDDKEVLMQYLLAVAKADTNILIKASRGMRFEEITQRLI